MNKVLSVGIILMVSCALLSTRPAQAKSATQRSDSQTPKKAEAKNGQISKRGGRAGADEYYEMGLAHYKAGRYKEAIDAFKRAIRLKPNNADMHYNLGLAYYSTNYYPEAADAYKNAVRLKEDWAEAHFRLGVMYYVLGRRSPALDQYKTLQKLNPELAQKLHLIIKEETSSVPVSMVASATKEVDKKQVASSPAVAAPSQSGASNRLVETSVAPVTNDPPSQPNSASSSTSVPATKNDSPSSGVATPPAKGDAPSNTGLVANSTDKAPAGPLTSIYRVGVGDVLDIRLTNSTTNRSTLYTVIDGGTIEYPLAGGPVAVAGKTTEEIDAHLTEELKRRAVQENSEVVVSVRVYASHNVIVSGLVNNPGTRVLRREAVPLYVLLAEAQPRIEAGRVVIMGETGQSPIMDLTDPAAMSTLVRPGDVINVLPRLPQYYYIGGRIHMPGQKAFQPGITLLQAILAAGGLERSSENNVVISREGADGRLSMTRYSLKDIRSGKLQDPRIQPGDRIEVGK